MFGKNWVVKVPKGIRKEVLKSFSECTKGLNTSPEKLEKLLKLDSKKAKKVALEIHACLLKRHPVLRGPRHWSQINIEIR